MNETKVCRDCEKEKPISEFYRNFRYKNGNWYYRAQCKECYRPQRNAADRKKWQADEERQDKLRSASRQRYAANPKLRERARERKQAWLAKQTGTPHENQQERPKE